MQEVKKLTKLEWMLSELHKEDYFPTEETVNRVLAGEDLDFLEPTLVDFVLELESEWATEGNR